MKIIITGSAGFIGFHVTNYYLENGHDVIGVDSLNNYYDVSLKKNRLVDAGIAPGDLQYGKIVKSSKYEKYGFIQLNLEDKNGLVKLFEEHQPEIVINLAAQAGVRYSIINPEAYISSNISGFLNVLECCRSLRVKHLIYASSSSVYGLNGNNVFSLAHNTDHPISLYAATKKSNELMAHTYSHLFNVPTTGLRFFTVYGPWGRPDMALFLFTKAILNNEPIEVYNNGDMARDFTYIDDIVKGIVQVAENPPLGNTSWDSISIAPAASSAPFRVFNIGNSKPINLLEFIEAIENEVGKKANKKMLPLQPGDVKSTYADVKDLEMLFGYKPATSIKDGVKNFVNWYKKYYNHN